MVAKSTQTATVTVDSKTRNNMYNWTRGFNFTENICYLKLREQREG